MTDLNCINRSCSSFMRKTRTPANNFICPDCIPADKQFVRTNDPANSQDALTEYDIPGATHLMAGLLLANVGRWFSTEELRDYGGQAADRRVRQLRTEHAWPITTRRRPAATNVWESRLDRMP